MKSSRHAICSECVPHQLLHLLHILSVNFDRAALPGRMRGNLDAHNTLFKQEASILTPLL